MDLSPKLERLPIAGSRTSKIEIVTADSIRETTKRDHIRNLIAYWFLGLTNNFAYVVMLSAAHDILATETDSSSTTDSPNITSTSTPTDERNCNQMSTGAILLADIIPSLLIKLTAPFFMHLIPYEFRIIFVIVFQSASYLLVAFSVDVTMGIFGVICASLSSGLGEISFLSLAAHFNKDVISTWSSGTGGAGLFGSLAYAGLTQCGLSPTNTLLIMLVVPVIMAVCFWFVLVFPSSVHRIKLGDMSTWITKRNVDTEIGEVNHEKFSRKLQLIVPLLPYMIPLSLVYFGEYFINQGLHELLSFPGIWITRKEQYRWYQVDYQLGVFVSRSSVNIIRIKPIFLPLLAVLQLINMILLFCDAYYLFIGQIWIIFIIIFYEGLLGGSSYVNTFYQIHQKIHPRYVEFSLGVASMADSFGIVIAGLSSIPAHNWICNQPLR